MYLCILKQENTTIRDYVPEGAALEGLVIHRPDGEWQVQKVVAKMPRGFLKRQREREPMMRA